MYTAYWASEYTDLFMKFFSCYCGGGASNHLGRPKWPAALHKQSSTIHPLTTASPLSYHQDTVIVQSAGHSHVAAAGLFRGGFCSDLVYLVGPPEDELRL